MIPLKNIPLYIAQGGTASLVLKEIPHRGIGYVLLRTVLPGQLAEVVEECAGFCRSCGADRVLVSQGPEPLDSLVHDHDMLLLRVEKRCLPAVDTPVTLVPLDPDNDAIYQRIYNVCFADVSGAATYDREAIARIYREAQLGFLALDPAGAPMGMGELHGNELAAIGLLPEYRGRGRGRDLALTLLHHCPGPEITLTAASDNHAALALYNGLGFTVRRKISAWYQA